MENTIWEASSLSPSLSGKLHQSQHHRTAEVGRALWRHLVPPLPKQGRPEQAAQGHSFMYLPEGTSCPVIQIITAKMLNRTGLSIDPYHVSAQAPWRIIFDM